MLEQINIEKKNIVFRKPYSPWSVFGWWILATVPLVAFLMGPTIPNDLVTDDYYWLWYFQPKMVNPLGMIPGSGHYSPTAQVLLALWYRLFGINGIPYHLLSVGLYWLGAIAVAWLAWKLTGNLAVGLISGSIMLINHQPAQAYIWAVGIWYPLSTLFYIAGFAGYLMAITAPNLRRAKWWYLLFIAGLGLGLVTHEQGWTLVGVTALHCFWLVDWQDGKLFWQVYTWSKLFQRVLFFLPALLLTMAAVAARYIILKDQAAQPLPQFPVYEAWVSILRSFLPGLSRTNGIDLSLGLAGRLGFGTTPQLLLFIVQYTILVVVFMLASRKYKFFLFWTAVQVIALLYALGFLFPRHYYLAVVPSIILWSCLLYSLFNWLWRRLSRFSLNVRQITVGILAALLALGFFATQWPEHKAWQDTWASVTATSTRVFNTIQRIAADNPGPTKLVILNLPDTYIAPNKEWIGVFNAGAPQAVNFYVPRRFTSVSLMRTPVNKTPEIENNLPFNLNQPDLPYLYPGVGQDVSFSQVQAVLADPNTLVVNFDIATMNVAQVKPSSGRTGLDLIPASSADLSEDQASSWLVKGPDPQLTFNLSKATNPYQYLEFEISGQANGQVLTGGVYFKTDNASFGENHLLPFEWKADGNRQVIRVPFAKNPAWQGRLAALRVDPINVQANKYIGTALLLENIKFFDVPDNQ